MDKRLLLALGFVLLLGIGGFGVWKMTRGIRNNNPGNIRYNPANQWQGQVGKDDAGFVVFDKPENGIRALSVLLRNYQNKYGLNTIHDIIARWAPPNENDTAAYISSVSKQANLASYVNISLNDKATLTKIVNAIIHQENGINPYEFAIINTGVMSA